MNITFPTKECDICHDKIKLYEPWYSVFIKKRLLGIKHSELMKQNPTVLCRNCFQAYKNFLIEREVQENHKRNWIDIKKEEL